MFLTKFVSLIVILFTIRRGEASYTTSSTNFIGCYSMTTSYAVFTSGLTSAQAGSINGLVGSTTANTPGGYAVIYATMSVKICIAICLQYSFVYAGIGSGSG